MVERALAWSPGHVSGYFRRCAGPDGAATGSIGGGIVIAEGVIVEAVRSDAPGVRVLVCSAGGREAVSPTARPRSST